MDKTVEYKLILDFGPFVNGIKKIQKALANVGASLNRRKYISTSYAPKLGLGTDI